MHRKFVWSGLFLMGCGAFLLGENSASAKGKDGYSKQEVRLSELPKYKIKDRRLRKIFKKMVKQYKHIYGHASADGYILPNELRDLKFQRGFMYRLFLIDKRHREAKTQHRRFQRKCRRKYRKEYRRYRRLRRRYRRRRYRHKRKRLKKPKLASADRHHLSDLKLRFTRYETMIRRFACRYLPQYKRRYRKSHCRKRY